MRMAILLLLFLASCGPATLEDCQKEADGKVRKLISELSHIHSKEDIDKGRMRQAYLEIAQVVEKAQKIRSTMEQGSVVAPPVNRVLNQKLYDELVRVYSIPGARALIEECQEDALVFLEKS